MRASALGFENKMSELLDFMLRHWELSLATLIVLTLIIVVEIRERINGVLHASAHEAVRLINKENGMIVDVRDVKLFQQGHILDAQSIPFAQLPTQFAKLVKQKEKPIILVCMTGNQSLQAAKLLRHHGFKRVYSLKGGMGAWRVAGLPMAKV